MPRKSPRDRKCIPATVIHGNVRVVAQIEDASVHGLRLRGPLRAAVGSRLTIQALGSVVMAELRWCKDGCLGVALVEQGSTGDLGRFITRLMRAPLPGRGARMHGFSELAALRPALPAAPLPAATPPRAPPQTRSAAPRVDHRPDGSDRRPGSS